MICPKCGFSQPDDIYCALCGVSIERYERYLRQRKKRKYKVYLLVALIGIAGLSIATYIKSVRHVEPPGPLSKYVYKEKKNQVKDVTLPVTSPHQILVDKPESQRKTSLWPRSESQEPMPDRREDKDLGGDESTRKSPLDQKKVESRDEEEDETKKAREWFEKGRALDDESEAEAQCYEKSIELNPKFAPAYYFLGAIYCRQANYELADQRFAKFLKYASEADRNAYDIYVYYSPSDVERISEEKVEGEVPVKETKKEKPPEARKETAEPTME